ncbi:histidine kinase [Hymenobacter sp. HSC-4F20]|uniref:sensor histidine kinase n=1 Tax=Hymenobacter sp. HSC-4F20 TaxID=2864135 RepID=UPI001C72F966|nr:histidine kinase [Hymenobacter sp. HSC-4F20]MBX0288870.1 histidine kinase [Hymenobacter sp. HSC-4F20]
MLESALPTNHPAPATEDALQVRKTSLTNLGRHYPHRKWAFMLGLMLILSVVMSFVFCRKCSVGSEDFLVTFGYNFFYTTGLWLANGFPSEWLNRRVDWTIQPIKRFLITLSMSLVLSLIVIFIVTTSFNVLYHHRPLSSITWRPFVMPLLITVVVSLFLHSRSFLLSWRDATTQAERLQKENALAQADSLRRQLDPHFLFNSLNALTSLVEENDPARATRFIRQLSQVYRYVLDSQDQEVVPLADEMRFVEAYLFLQRTRLGEGVQVEMRLPPAALDTLFVPPLAVQLLLENALKHNATSQRDPLRIRIELDETARTLAVRNIRRPRRLPDGESTGLGLKNLRARYAFLTSQPVRVEESDGEFGVVLPVLELR